MVCACVCLCVRMVIGLNVKCTQKFQNHSHLLTKRICCFYKAAFDKSHITSSLQLAHEPFKTGHQKALNDDAISSLKTELVRSFTIIRLCSLTDTYSWYDVLHGNSELHCIVTLQLTIVFELFNVVVSLPIRNGRSQHVFPLPTKTHSGQDFRNHLKKKKEKKNEWIRSVWIFTEHHFISLTHEMEWQAPALAVL